MQYVVIHSFWKGSILFPKVFKKGDIITEAEYLKLNQHHKMHLKPYKPKKAKK